MPPTTSTKSLAIAVAPVDDDRMARSKSRAGVMGLKGGASMRTLANPFVLRANVPMQDGNVSTWVPLLPFPF